MHKKMPTQESGWVWCRPGDHRVRRNKIAVDFEPGYGICGECIVKRCRKIAEYWTHGLALDVYNEVMAWTDEGGVESGEHIEQL